MTSYSSLALRIGVLAVTLAAAGVVRAQDGITVYNAQHASLTQAWADAEAYALNTYMVASTIQAGGHIGAEASLNKIFWSELDQRMHETAMSILSARAELLPHAPAAAGVGTWLDGFLFAQSGPIYAGTNEIQRNIIAERMLGMPR